MNYTADFETTTKETDCRVWAWGLYGLEDKSFLHGNNISSFFSQVYDLSKKQVIKVYFHNLKFDGEFLISHLLASGFEFVPTKKELAPGTFTTLITDNKIFYSIEVCFNREGKKVHKVVFLDSLKIIPFSVEVIAKSFDLPIRKLDLDYSKERPPGYELTPSELAYLKNDVEIVGQALNTLFSEGLNKMTAASNALEDLKKTFHSEFRDLFPILKYDKEIRESYKGGFTYLNPKFKGKTLGSGIVLDVNSLYPSIMRNKPLPYGRGRLFKGQYVKDDVYPLFIQMIRCQFKLKPNKIPSIQIKKNFRFLDNQYLENSGYEEVVLCLTSVDLDLFLTQYDVFNLEYMGGWKFKATTGIFKTYIDKWTQVKIQSAIDGNRGMYTLSKLMLNSTYGKFATNPRVQGAFPYMDESGVVQYGLLNEDERDPIYLPVATFITSYARKQTIEAAQDNYNRFIYADTDSIHLVGEKLPKNLEIHPTELGSWDHETTFSKAKYLRQKAYIQDVEDKTLVTIAGMPSSLHDHVNYDNFNEGTTFTFQNKKDSNTVNVPVDKAKLRPKRVPGGAILEPTFFTIRK